MRPGHRVRSVILADCKHVRGMKRETNKTERLCGPWMDMCNTRHMSTRTFVKGRNCLWGFRYFLANLLRICIIMYVMIDFWSFDLLNNYTIVSVFNIRSSFCCAWLSWLKMKTGLYATIKSKWMDPVGRSSKKRNRHPGPPMLLHECTSTVTW